MSEFIALSVMTAEDKSKTGIDKYTAYFVKTSRYEKFREGTNDILRVQGYEQCIVTTA